MLFEDLSETTWLVSGVGTKLCYKWQNCSFNKLGGIFGDDYSTQIFPLHYKKNISIRDSHPWESLFPVTILWAYVPFVISIIITGDYLGVQLRLWLLVAIVTIYRLKHYLLCSPICHIYNRSWYIINIYHKPGDKKIHFRSYQNTSDQNPVRPVDSGNPVDSVDDQITSHRRRRVSGQNCYKPRWSSTEVGSPLGTRRWLPRLPRNAFHENI